MSVACQSIVPEASRSVPDPHSATDKQKYINAWSSQVAANYDCMRRRVADGQVCAEACKNIPRAEDFLEDDACTQCLEDADKTATDERCMVDEMEQCLDGLVGESHPFDFVSNESTRDSLIRHGFGHRQPFDDTSLRIFYTSLFVLFVCLTAAYLLSRTLNAPSTFRSRLATRR